MIGVTQSEARANDRDKAIRRFERLEKLCPFCKLDREERNREMLKRFHLDITIFVETGGQPTTVAKCHGRALRA